MNNLVSNNALRDSFFLNLAKLFDKTQSKKTKSIPKIQESLKKNSHLFKNEEWRLIDISINNFERNIMNYSDIIKLVIDHRNECLAHPDKVNNCNHINNIDTKQTNIVINHVVMFLDDLATFYDI